MKINLIPQRSDAILSVIKSGDVLEINGVQYDFSPLPDGATLPRDAVSCEFIASDVNRVNGELEFDLTLPHSAQASEAARFPQPLIDPADGELELPL